MRKFLSVLCISIMFCPALALSSETVNMSSGEVIDVDISGNQQAELNYVDGGVSLSVDQYDSMYYDSSPLMVGDKFLVNGLLARINDYGYSSNGFAEITFREKGNTITVFENQEVQFLDNGEVHGLKLNYVDGGASVDLNGDETSAGQEIQTGDTFSAGGTTIEVENTGYEGNQGFLSFIIEDRSQDVEKEIPLNEYVQVNEGENLLFGPENMNEMKIDRIYNPSHNSHHYFEFVPGIGTGTISDDLRIVFPDGRDNGGMIDVNFSQGKYSITISDHDVAQGTARLKLVPEYPESSDFNCREYPTTENQYVFCSNSGAEAEKQIDLGSDKKTLNFVRNTEKSGEEGYKSTFVDDEQTLEFDHDQINSYSGGEIEIVQWRGLSDYQNGDKQQVILDVEKSEASNEGFSHVNFSRPSDVSESSVTISGQVSTAQGASTVALQVGQEDVASGDGEGIFSLTASVRDIGSQRDGREVSLVAYDSLARDEVLARKYIENISERLQALEDQGGDENSLKVTSSEDTASWGDKIEVSSGQNIAPIYWGEGLQIQQVGSDSVYYREFSQGNEGHIDIRDSKTIRQDYVLHICSSVSGEKTEIIFTQGTEDTSAICGDSTGSGYSQRDVERITDFLGGNIDGVEEKTEIRFGDELQNSLFVKDIDGDYIREGSVTLSAGSKNAEEFEVNWENLIEGVKAEFSSGSYSLHLCHKTFNDEQASIAIAKEDSGGYTTCFNDEKAGDESSFEAIDYSLGQPVEVSAGDKLVFGEAGHNSLYVTNFKHWDNMDRSQLEAYANKLVDAKKILPVEGTATNDYFYDGNFNIYFCSQSDSADKGIVSVTREDMEQNIACKGRSTDAPSGEVSIPSDKYPAGTDIPVKYDINQRGQYKVQVNLDDRNLKRHDIGKADAQQDIFNVNVDQAGNLKAELIASGTWWNPLDNDKVISRTTSDIIQNREIVDLEFETERLGKQGIYLSTNVEASGGIDSITWDLNDDNQYERNGRTLNHSFETGGDKEITMRAVAGESMKTLTKTVSVEASRTGKIEVIDSCSFSREDYDAAGIEAEAPRLTAILSDSTPGYDEFDIFWRVNGRDIGEKVGVQPGTALPAVEPDTENLEPGTHRLSAFAMSGSGEVVDNKSCGGFTVEGVSIQPEIEIENENIELNEQISFRGYPEGDYQYSWDLNNDNQYERDGREVNTEYSSPGDKTIKLKVTAEGQEFETERNFKVEEPRTSSSISLSKTELTPGESLEIGYDVSPDIAENGYRVVIRNPSGETIKDLSKSSESGSEIFVPDSENEKGGFTAELLAEEGFLSSIMRRIFGPEQRKSFEVVSASENLDPWRKYCQDSGFDPLSSSGRAACISQEIGPECFKENPGDECREIANSVCEYYLETDFNPEIGKCGE